MGIHLNVTYSSQVVKMAERKMFTVEIVNPVREYVKLMRNIFDFQLLRTFVSSGEFKVIADGMHGGMEVINYWRRA